MTSDASDHDAAPKLILGLTKPMPELQRRPGEVTDAQRSRLADALVRTGTEDRAAFREVYRLSSAKLFVSAS